MKMLQRTLAVIAIATLSLLCFASALAPAAASAQTDVFKDVCTEPSANNSSVCKATGENNLSGPNGIIIKVANIFAFVTGVAAVFVIMIGGFIYITASGDTGKANGGRSAVIYAAIGLVVVVVGRAIIGFVITKFK